MLWKWTFLTVFVSAKNILCINSVDSLKEEWVQESDFFELMEPINGQWRIDNGTNSSNLIADSDPTMDPVVITLAALVGAPILLAAVAPPQLPVFPPQGVPQPGSLAEGGGLLPASAIIVRKIYILQQFLSVSNNNIAKL